MRILILILLAVFLSFGCDDDKINGIVGTLTIEAVDSLEDPTSGAYYVYLDDDIDITNGYTKQVTGTLSPSQRTASYSIDTSDVPEGSYYLQAGYDTQSATNMDPLNPSIWEGKGWYGSGNSSAPDSANVTGLNGKYNITVYGLAK